MLSNSKDDELQAEKLDEIIQLLVAAGYFRARIKGLPVFDKIVGGLVWCIQVCAFDIDIELLFNENSNIGTKIALTEKIVRVLAQMKCPHHIEPHQIQGNDFIHIFPVIQWLVKKALETREQTHEYNRAFARYQLEKNHGLASEKATNVEIYQPVRSYRHNAPNSLSRDVLLDTILMEYSQNRGSDEEKSSTIFNGMLAIDEIKIDDSKMSQLFEKQQQELLEAVNEFRVNQGEPEIKFRQIEALRREIGYKEKSIETLETSISEKKAALSVQNEKLQEANDEFEILEAQSKKVADGGGNTEEFEQICNVLKLIDEMKIQESLFKKECREELARLNEVVETEQAKLNTEGSEVSTELEDTIEQNCEQVSAMRIKLAKLNRQIAKLERNIDQIPSRSELTQYQKRFVELHAQVAATHKETKQYYTLYNTMNDLCTYLEKEINLINSIHENYTQAMSSSGQKEIYLSQLDTIVQGVRQNRMKVERRRHEVKMEKDRLQREYMSLIEKQRLYVKTVADFKEELRQNQILVSKLAPNAK